MNLKRKSILLAGIFLALNATAWTAVAQDNVIRLATTTSTDNSGLLRQLLPVFEQTYGITVHTIVGGTGRALNHARSGDVDVILVHAREAELKLIEEGFGVSRNEVMYNEFVIVGPGDNSAGIESGDGLGGALTKVSAAGALFISRGDDSGTHKKELSLWQDAGIVPDGTWYREVGQGMGKALQIADQLGAYTMSDKGTWLFTKNRLLSLKLLLEGASDGRNVYSAIAVNPEKHSNVNYESADLLVEWLQSPQARELIANYKIGGETLFYPVASSEQ